MNSLVPKRLLIPLAFLAFVSLGLPDTLLGVAWPSIRATFALPISSLGLLSAFGIAGYLASSFFAGAIVHRLGVGMLLVVSGAVVTIALLGYAASPVWPGLWLAALVAGLGAGAIDSGVNGFGSRAFSPRVLNWLHACWGIGATAGPFVMTAAIEGRHGWRLGYAVVGAMIALLTVVFFYTRDAWQADGATIAAAADAPPAASIREAARDGNVRRQTLFFFLYTGAEAAVGNWLFTLLTESRGVSIGAAGTVTGLYWAALTGGRIAFGQFAHAAGPVVALRVGLVGSVVGAALLFPIWPTPLTFAGAVLLGFSLAPLFPTMIALTPTRVGERLAMHAVSFQVSAAGLGIATFSALVGLLARSRFGIEVLPPVVFVLTVALVALHEIVERAASRRRLSIG